MTSARRLGTTIGVVVLLLFAGRWVAGVLADRWWAAGLSPAAAQFLTQSHLLRFALKLAGVLVASAWFIGHLVVVYRAVGTVQIRRHVANIEIREALTPRTLLSFAIGGGALLGILVGSRVSDWWRDVLLAWNGVRYGILDPMLERDLGLYIAQLPLWRSAHNLYFILVVLAIGLVFGLYLLVGAVRWMEGRPAITDHARRHLGWLLLAFGVALAWGYLLEPYELVAGLTELPPDGAWRVAVSVAPVLAGIALAAGGLSAVWAIQPRHALVAAAWLVLAMASIGARWILPAMFEDPATATNDARTVERFTRYAYGLDGVRVERLRAPARAPDSTRGRVTDRAPDAVPNSRPGAITEGVSAAATHPALWSGRMVSHATGGDSAAIFWADLATLDIGGTPRPAWLVLRPASNEGRLAIWAMADDRVGTGGVPLFYSPSDTLTHSTPTSFLDVSEQILRPDAPSHILHEASGAGVRVDSWFKRVTLTWALQAGALLGRQPTGARVDWHLSPAIRLARLAPFADWGTPLLRIIDGELVWITDGYVTSSTFPLAHRMRWRRRTVGSVRAGFVGVVDANTGRTSIYLRPGAQPLAHAWAATAEGLIEPEGRIPDALLRALPYPVDLFRVQVQEFERSPWRAGALAGWPIPGAPESELPRTDVQWGADSGGPIHVAVYDQPGGRTISALVVGKREGGRDVLHLFRFDSTAVLPSRSVLESRWDRIPSYELLNDSVQEDGGRLERGPIRYEPVHGGAIAYQPNYARRAGEYAAVVWINVAAPRERLGAGRTFSQAWSNLLGGAGPMPPGRGEREGIASARSWLRKADSALRSGNWAAFGRAWRELERALGVRPDSAAPDSATMKDD